MVQDSPKTIQTEIVAVLITAALKFIFMDWLNLRAFYITAAILFWAIFVFIRYKRNPAVMQRWGIRKQHFWISMKALLPFALVFIPVTIIYGYMENEKLLNWHILPILLFYPLWGSFQQFIVTGLIAGNLRNRTAHKLSENWIVFSVSFLFALLHLPYLPLAVYVFVMQYLFLRVFFRYRNIWALGFYHGIVSSFFLYFVSGRDLLQELYAIFV